MRQVTMYGAGFSEVYESCVRGVADARKSAEFSAAFAGLEAEGHRYEELAARSDLYVIAAVKSSLNDVVRGALTRKDLKELYEVNMVGARKEARIHYDYILLSPKYKKCPYCGLGQATTLDHYLPKSRFPQFSVSVCNLVPSCRDCQSKKGRDYALHKSSQTLHPYFDNPSFFNESWVKAEVVSGVATTIRFYVDPPGGWSLAMKSRVQAHFIAHELEKRFGIEAACELAAVNESLAELRSNGQFNEIKYLLSNRAVGYARECVNSWQSALYAALAGNVWYCTSSVV
ncbi:TPA: hypothetical protein UOJ25_001943 [Stenotrophomonas maltophilia]|nr:hypothetical protein [Stenotrophomonas maltophilia]